jgi:hypothetical protein
VIDECGVLGMNDELQAETKALEKKINAVPLLFQQIAHALSWN